jgi:hypothetical protein
MITAGAPYEGVRSNGARMAHHVDMPHRKWCTR